LKNIQNSFENTFFAKHLNAILLCLYFEVNRIFKQMFTLFNLPITKNENIDH